MSDAERGGFTDDPSLPYLQYTFADQQTVLFAPAREDDTLMKRIFTEVGIQRYVSLEQNGTLGTHSLFKMLWRNPYAEALITIGQLEGEGELPTGSHHNALQAIMDENFDTSPWADYLPAPDTEA